MKRSRSHWRPLSITALYLFMSAAWIIVSDSLLHSLQLSHRVEMIVGISKGMTYLAVTAAFIFVILRKLNQTKEGLERDVSNRTTALLMSEADLRKSEERMRGLLANLPDVTRTSGSDGRISYISANVLHLVGFTAEEVCAFPPEFWLNRIHEDDRQRVIDGYKRLFKKGTGIDEEFRIRHRDGRWVWLHDRATRTKNGRFHADGIFSDVTKRKEAEEQARHYEGELRSNEKKLRQSLTELGIALEASRAGIWDLELESRRLTLSDELRQVYGMKRGEFKETMEDWVSCVMPEDAALILPKFEEDIQHGGGRWEFRIKRRDDGEIRWIEARGQVVYEGERPVRVLGISTDITDRKRAELEMGTLEEQFRHAQKMEAVGRLAGGVAHDFNNLLMVIRGYSEVINERLPAADSLRKYAAEVIKASDRASSLTGQLLAFSRKQVLTPVVFSLEELVNDTTKMLKRLIGEDVELYVSTKGSPWRVKADRDQIVQVLMNLCVNARDAMPKGGALRIEVENTTVEAEDREQRPYLEMRDYVKLTVEDTGCGIAPDVQDHIFEPFFTTKDTGKGTGLGLSTVYGIVKQSNGYIWVDSKPGVGTCFTIYLPKALEESTQIAAAEAPVTKGGTETILVVEDEEGLRGAIREYLQGLDYKVLSCGSGPEAIETANNFEGDIAVLLTDVVMPRMSGTQLAEELRQTNPGIKVVYMSGYIDDSALRHGVQESQVFLQKPFKLAALAGKLRDILGEPQPSAG